LTTSAPTFSIVIPTKDRPDLLRRACQSALRAAGTSGEVIVVDDSSKIPAHEALLMFSSQRLRVISLMGKSGVGAARNAGLHASRGSVIFFLDDDDEIEPNYCSNVLGGPAAFADFGFSNYYLVKDVNSAQLMKPRFRTGPINTRASIRRRTCGMGMGFWIRQEAIALAGPINEELVVWEDADYVFRLISLGLQQWYSAHPGMRIHDHSTQSSGTSRNVTIQTSHAVWERTVRSVLDHYPFARRDFSLHYIKICAKAMKFDRGFRFIRVNRSKFGLGWSLLLKLYLFYRRRSRR